MNYAQIIRESWHLTLHNPKLKWFAFVPSFIGVIVFAVEIAWQLFMLLEEFGILEIDFFESMVAVAGFVLSSGLVLWVLFLALVILFFIYILPAWIEGVLIYSIKHLEKDPLQPLYLRQRMVQGFEVFFRIFELRALLGLASLWTLLLFTGTLYRYYHDTLFQVIWPLLVIYALVCLFINVFSHFAEHFIVFEGDGVIDSLKQSFTLVFLNMGSMMAIFLIMVLVNLRVLINVLTVIGVPLAVIWIFTYFSSSIVQGLTILLAFVLLGLTSYLTAVLEIFSTSVWTKTYLAFKQKQDQLRDVPTNKAPSS